MTKRVWQNSLYSWKLTHERQVKDGKVYQLGLVPYLQAWNWQKKLVSRAIADPNQKDCLLIVEHPDVYTLGTGATVQHVKFDLQDPAYEWHRIERGGEVTHHTPGQLVVYPILNLNRHQRDLHWYLRQLEAVVILTLQHFELEGERIAGLTGVWVQGYKVAAVGIKVSRWVTCHGFALNVCPMLQGFRQIVPCGIPDRPVGTLKQFCPEINKQAVQTQLIQSFESIFQMHLCPVQPFPFLNA